jgi:hypothetical protein
MLIFPPYESVESRSLEVTKWNPGIGKAEKGDRACSAPLCLASLSLTPGFRSASFGLLSLEGAIARAGRVSPSSRARRKQLERHQLQIDTAFVPYQVHVAAPSIHKPFPGRDDMWRTSGIVAVVVRRRARFDCHQTRSRVRMPAGVTARREDVVHDIDIRESMRLDLGSVSVGVDFDLDIIEGRRPENGAAQP